MIDHFKISVTHLKNQNVPALLASQNKNDVQIGDSYDYLLQLKNFNIQKLAFALFFDKDLLEKLPNFFDKKIIQFLSYKNIIVEHLSKPEVVNQKLLLTKTENDAIDRFSIAVDPKKEKFANDFENIFDVLETIMEENLDEDEIQIREKKLDKNSQAIEEKFAKLVSNLSKSIDFFINHLLKNSSNEVFKTHLHSIFENVSECCLTGSFGSWTSLSLLYKSIFSYIFSDKSLDTGRFSQISYDVHLNESSRATIEEFERFVMKIDPAAIAPNENLSKIWLEYLAFAVACKLDPNVKRRIFSLTINQSKNANEFTLFKFICSNLNDLFFNECFNDLQTLAVNLAEKNNEIADLLLFNLLEYQDFALKVIFENLQTLNSKGLMAQQIVKPI